MTPQVATSIRIDEDILDSLREQQERTGVSVSEQIRRALRAWLDTKVTATDYPLTEVERRILSNQLRLLEKAYPGESAHLEAERYALEHGYSTDYRPEGISREELDPHVVREVLDVLRMFELLQVARTQLKPKGVSDDDVAFPGFDANEEPQHFGYCEFFIEHKGRYKHLKTSDGDLNSHAPHLDRYRSMLRVFRRLNRNAFLSEQQMRKLLEASN